MNWDSQKLWTTTNNLKAVFSTITPSIENYYETNNFGRINYRILIRSKGEITEVLFVVNTYLDRNTFNLQVRSKNHSSFMTWESSWNLG